MKIKDCYASELDECEGDISREHIISQSLIGESIKAHNGEMEFDFLRGDFVIKNLCVSHNNSFRKVESHIKHFKKYLFETSQLYKTINECNENELSTLSLPRRFRVKGEYLEKWMVKTVINYCYFMNGSNKPNLNFKYLSNRLFNYHHYKFEFPYGLSILHPKSQFNNSYPGQIKFEIIKDVNDEIGGVIVNSEGYLFLVLFPTENSHSITRTGIKYKDELFLVSDKSLDWHSVGFRENQFSSDKKLVTSSEIFIRW